MTGQIDNLRAYLERLDEPHRAYARAYADELAVGDVPPVSTGLDRDVVREIRRRVWGEWRRRIASMPRGRRS